MLTRDDCVALCDLTEDEIKAIARHEHVPLILATEIGHYLVHQPDGPSRIRRIILDDIEEARAQHRYADVLRLKTVYCRFAHSHPATRAPGGDGR